MAHSTRWCAHPAARAAAIAAVAALSTAAALVAAGSIPAAAAAAAPPVVGAAALHRGHGAVSSPLAGLATAARATVNTTQVCGSNVGVAFSRTGVVCPCFFRYNPSSLLIDAALNVSLTLSAKQPTPLSIADVDAAEAVLAAALWSRKQQGTNGSVMPGEPSFSQTDDVVINSAIAVDLIVSVTEANVSAIPCPSHFDIVLESAPPACPARDISVGGTGSVLPPPPPCALAPVARLSGGTVLADPFARSFVVAVEAGGGVCSGTLLSPRHVLTAAHCEPIGWHSVLTLPPAVHPETGTLAARDAMARVPIARHVPHPGFVYGEVAGPDLAVLVLGADAPDYPAGDTPPAVIGRDASAPAVGSAGRVAGFGAVSRGFSNPGPRSLDLRVHSLDACRERWVATLGNRSASIVAQLNELNHVCTLDADAACNTCNEDSGGALFQTTALPGGGVQAVVMAVVSFGPPGTCSDANSPSMWSRVGPHAEWIEGVMAEPLPTPSADGDASPTG